MSQHIQIKNNDLKAMKTIDMRNSSEAREYLNNVPSKTHTKEELEALHRAIAFTQQFKQAESYAKMDEEETLTRPIRPLPINSRG